MRGESRLTPKDYRPNYLSNVRTYHLPPPHALARWRRFVCTNPLGQVYCATLDNGISPIKISEEFSHSSSVFLAQFNRLRKPDLIEFGYCRLEFIKRQFTGFYRIHNGFGRSRYTGRCRFSTRLKFSNTSLNHVQCRFRILR